MLGYPQNQERSPLDPVVDGLAADRCSAAAQDDPHLLGGPHRAGDLRCPAGRRGICCSIAATDAYLPRFDSSTMSTPALNG
jgi:hypothetical protein